MSVIVHIQFHKYWHTPRWPYLQHHYIRIQVEGVIGCR